MMSLKRILLYLFFAIIFRNRINKKELIKSVVLPKPFLTYITFSDIHTHQQEFRWWLRCQQNYLTKLPVRFMWDSPNFTCCFWDTCEYMRECVCEVLECMGSPFLKWLEWSLFEGVFSTPSARHYFSVTIK